MHHFALALALAFPGDRITGRHFATRSEALGAHGMAATSIPAATLAAVDTLRAGGSAIDAAIAANAVQTLLEPTGCGVGGDLFAIVWDPKERALRGYNGSGRSPAALTLAELQKRGITRMPKFGVLPISVPGCVEAWCALHERYGKLPLEKVLEPAIRLAREGAPVSELVAYYWARGAKVLASEPGFTATFTRDGKPPAKGERWKNEGLASTLERVAKEGRAGFYEGDVARTTADFVQASGGFLSYDDLASHRGEWVDPVSTSYRGHELWELPPNGQGIAALQMLNVLERFDVAKAGFGSVEHAHWFLEAKKLAFEDRARFYADMAFAHVPVATLISKEYAAERAKLVGSTAAKSVPPGNPALEHGDTIYLATADASGMMVSLIQSNYRGFGSGVCPPGLGFSLQDRGEMFDLEPGRANTYAPRKRPFHTIIPAFLTQGGEPLVAFGVMGGATQPQGHVQIVMNLVDFRMNLQEAGDAPRLLHDGSSEPTGERMSDGGKVYLESGFEPELARELVKKGHVVGWNVGDFGGYQAVMRDRVNGTWIGASESRKDGLALGY